MPLNDELFDKVLQRIDNDPDAFDMSTWLSVDSCGTVGCFAGHTVLELGYRAVANDMCACERDGKEHDVSFIAENALGLEEHEADYLFAAHTYYGEYNELFRKATRDDVVMRWKHIKELRDNNT